MQREIASDHTRGAVLHTRERERAIAALAERQHGVVARRQLVALGMSRRAIDHRMGAGRLQQVHRGVYAVGHRRLTRRSRWMAAVLAAGPGAVLSHRSAAALHGVRESSRIDVIAPRSRAPSPSLTLHRHRLAADERTVIDGIPVTTPSRTLLDLAGVLSRRELERALAQAERLRLADTLSLADLLARHRGRRGAAAVRTVLERRDIGRDVTRSELEERFLAVVAAAGLPRPRVNALVVAGGRRFEADCLWERERVIVELDGHATHATPAAFEADRLRDRALQAAGWRVVRVTWRQLHEDSAGVVADLRHLLAISPFAGGIPAGEVEAGAR